MLYLLLKTAKYHTSTPIRMITGIPIIKIHFSGDFFLAVIGGVVPFGAVLPKVIDGVGVDGAVVEAGSLANALATAGAPKLFT